MNSSRSRQPILDLTESPSAPPLSSSSASTSAALVRRASQSSTQSQRATVIRRVPSVSLVDNSSNDNDVATSSATSATRSNSLRSQRSLSRNELHASAATRRQMVDLTSPEHESVSSVVAQSERASAPVVKRRRTSVEAVDVDALIASDEEFARRLQREFEESVPRVVHNVDDDNNNDDADMERRRRMQRDEDLARAMQAREQAWAATRERDAMQMHSELLAASGVVPRGPAGAAASTTTAVPLVPPPQHPYHRYNGHGRRWRNRHRRHEWVHQSLYGPVPGGLMSIPHFPFRGLVGGVRLTGEALSLAQRELTDADYETLLALDDNVQPNRGASESLIAQLPTRVLGAKDNADTCVICMEEMTSGSSVTTLPCTHQFHDDCIRAWLVVNKRCPIDKEAID